MGISDRGTKAKTITSCDIAFVTNIGAVATLHYAFAQKHLLARDPAAQQMFYLCESIATATTATTTKAAHRTPPGSFALCDSDKSAQSERKSTTRYGEDS
ncbi:hypothetical protein [Lysinibacillus xylanilyticus]|uniref:hypothetical protein n=1 Tax=Lysinibacillus xylanilyticus TaxID=582475 RepID=UPI003D0892E9